MKRILFLILLTAFIIAMIFIVKASADLNNGLIAYYPFNGNATDESGNGRDGTVFGATLTEDRFGNPNSAYHFDGIDDYIDTNSTVGDNATALSVILWAYIETVDDWFTGIITRDREYANNEDVWSILLINDQFQYEISETNGLEYMITQSTTIGWHYLGLVYDGSGKRLKTYLDGELVEAKDTESGMLRSNPELKLVMGAYSGKSLPFSGIIDDVRIYNRVLSENEIQQLYNGPITIKIPEDATEGDGVLEDQGIVSIFSAPDTDLVINLSSDDISLVSVPETVTILADQNTTTFDIVVIDNCIDNAFQNVTITASASCYISGSDVIQVADNDVSVEMDLPSGWSMISLPTIPCNGSVSSLFSKAKTVYGYEKDTGYVRVTVYEDLEVEKGYWILLDQNQSLTLTGQPILSYKQTLYKAAWEMVGGCTYPAQASADCCNLEVIYDYFQGAGYHLVHGSEKLEPGKGYWILLRDFTCQACPNGEFPDMHVDFAELLSVLGFPIVTSCSEPNLQEQIIFFKSDQSGANIDQNIILTCMGMTPEQLNAYQEFAEISKSKISKARCIDKNNNELLFPEEKRHFYKSPSLEEISPANLPLLCGNDCPFEYTEYRKIQGENICISASAMTLKSNREKTLGPGLYFFVNLTLEKNSILNTYGPVQIYVKKLELKENAKIMGGTSTNPDECKPDNLAILAQRWYGAYYDPEDGVKIGPEAKVCGHIFAPDLQVILCKGSMSKSTKVYGSILAYQLVTAMCRADPLPGPIWIIYKEYTVNSGCDFELKVSN